MDDEVDVVDGGTGARVVTDVDAMDAQRAGLRQWRIQGCVGIERAVGMGPMFCSAGTVRASTGAQGGMT